MARGLRDCFRLVEEWSDEPLLDASNLLNWTIFNFIIGNADAHGKNLSFLYNGGLVRVAPFYDLISTATYRRLNSKFAMKMGGKSDARYLPQNTLGDFAGDIGIDIRTVRAAFVMLMDTIETKSAQLAEEYRGRFGDLVILGDIARVISYRIAKGRALVS